MTVNKLYEFNIRTVAIDGNALPQGCMGAYVPTYVAAEDHSVALQIGAKSLAQIGLGFDSLRGGVKELPTTNWNQYIARVWPEFASNLPTEAALAEIIERGGVFYGPIATFG